MAIPLPTLLGLIVGGVVVALAIIHLLGWSAPAEIADVEAAGTRFRLDHPDACPASGWVAADGRSALLELDEGVGLVVVLGDRTVVRRLGRGSLASVRTDPTHTHLRLRDPAFPRARLALPASDERDAWLRRLSPCVQVRSA